MSAAVEGVSRKRPSHSIALVVRDEAGGQDQYVRIVVAADQLRDLSAPDQTGPNALMLVECDGHPFARTADADAAGHFARLDRCAQRMGVVGVVDAFGRVGAEVQHLPAACRQKAGQQLLQFVTCMVAGDTDLFHSRYVF